MTKDDAACILKNWDCVCERGTSPTNCSDETCIFRRAIETITSDTAEELEKPEVTGCNRDMCYYNIMNNIDCTDCPCYSGEDSDHDK